MISHNTTEAIETDSDVALSGEAAMHVGGSRGDTEREVSTVVLKLNKHFRTLRK